MKTKKYLDSILKLLTPDQMAFYERIYPEGPKNIKHAIFQIENTILSQNRAIESLKNVKKDFDEFREEVKRREDDLNRQIRILNIQKCQLENKNQQLSNPISIENADVQEKLEVLQALEDAGVDNWEWYGAAMESFK